MYYKIIMILSFVILIVLPILREYWKVILPIVGIILVVKFLIDFYLWGKEQDRWE